MKIHTAVLQLFHEYRLTDDQSSELTGRHWCMPEKEMLLGL
jgi:hypothetical protein